MQGYPFGLSEYTVLEVLQGARSEKDFADMQEYLLSQKIYRLPHGDETLADVAKMYFMLRKGGIRPRGTIGVLIAKTAILHDLWLLHNDKDFDNMAMLVHELKILEKL
jgi:predicted nucleic acid-binding protein